MEDDRNLYVRGFDETMTEEQIKEMFSRYGEVESVKIMRDENGNSRNFGFVCYVNKDDAEKCIDNSMVDVKFGTQNAFVAKALPKDQLSRYNLMKQQNRNKEKAHLAQAGGMGPGFGPMPGFPGMGGGFPQQMGAPAFGPMAGYPFGVGMDQGQMGFPQGAAMGGPGMMMPRDPKEMIRNEILDKLGRGPGQNAIKALHGLSEDQCKALSKDQEKLNAWLASVL